MTKKKNTSLDKSGQNKEQRLKRFVVRLEQQRKAREKLSRLYSRTRLVVAFSGFVATYYSYYNFGEAPTWIVIAGFLVTFIVLVRRHSRVILSIRKHGLYERIKTTHIARINRNWSALPASPQSESLPDHPFARDLNLTGPRSIHHLIDTSFTQEGSTRLRDWLTRIDPSPENTVNQRRLIEELVPLSAFRDRISLLSAMVTQDPDEKWEGGVLLRWLKSHTDSGRIVRVLLALGFLSVITPVTLLLHYTTSLGNWWAFSLLAYVTIYLYNARLYSHLFDEAEHLYYQLSRFRTVLLFLEKYRFGPRTGLKKLVTPFQDAEKPPSAYLKQAMWLSVAASAQKNDILRIVLNILMPWELFFAFVLGKYKMRLADRLPEWLEVLQCLEAAGSLASFADLNPKYTFPQTTMAGERGQNLPVFTAKKLGHPLIPTAENIPNDFELTVNGLIVLITGSNMSGKSTFLRTLGVNMSLAFAGGPVSAEALSTVYFRLFTCINVIDSVNDGISYFYAEVKRLKKLLIELETDHEYPVFFLIDEIFRGTNNRERFIGSRALLLALCEANGTGAVSTHDLELVELETESGAIQNFHFREKIEDGRMIFDYLLRPGPCPTTNALKIMEAEGLPVGN